MIPAEILAAAAGLLHMPIAELQAKLASRPKLKQEEPADRLLTPGEAAQMLSLSTRTLYEYIKKGALDHVHLAAGHRRKDGRLVGGRLGIPLSQVQAIVSGTVDITALLAKNKTEVRP